MAHVIFDGQINVSPIVGKSSDSFPLHQGAPRGSCVGTILFLLYASQLFRLVEKHLPNMMSFADDCQLYASFSVRDSTLENVTVEAMEKCRRDVSLWMSNHKVKINDSKSEFLLVGSKQMLDKVNVLSIKVGKQRCSCLQWS